MDQALPATKRSGRCRTIAVLRQLHRWLAVVLALFMMVIGLTGAVLQVIIIFYGEIKHGQGLSPAITPLHDLLFRIHTGALVRPISNYYGLICGFSLFYFTVSGLWMYLDMHRSRAARGQRGMFWRSGGATEAIWRSVHRWLTVALVVFMLVLSFTASSLYVDFLRFNTFPGGGPSDPRPVPGAPPPGPPGGDWHELNYGIHKLDFLGAPGHWVGILVGLGLFTFSFSGISMYFAMRARRVRAGLRNSFW